jgi:hypothetical protein
MIDAKRLVTKAKDLWGQNTFDIDREKGEKGTDEELVMQGNYHLPMLIQACLSDDIASLNLIIRTFIQDLRD